jgi:hypothetical protein
MPRPRPPRPRAPLIVSTISLIVALGGTSYAAFSLPKNSVGTNQLKNNAVTLVKIAPATQQALSKVGPQGEPGPQGIPGPPGINGANGTTHGYEAVANGPVDITADVIGQQLNLQTIGQLALPAGTFAVTVKAGYKVIAPAGTSTEVGLDCRLRDSSEGPRDFATVGGWLGAPNSVSQGAFDGTVTLAGDVANSTSATEIVECGDTNGASGIDYKIDNLVIQAVQLDSLN